jgi:hypothetical protein
VGGRGAGQDLAGTAPRAGTRLAEASYAEAKKQVDAVTQALIDRGFGPTGR